MGAPHPLHDELKRGLGRPSIGAYAHKSCPVNADVQVYVQGGRAPHRARAVRRRAATLFFGLVSVFCAWVVGSWTTAWDPAQEQVQRIAEVDAVRHLLDDRAPNAERGLRARARGAQVRRLAHARTLLARDTEAGLAAMRRVYAEAADEDVREAALDAIVAGARDRWPGGYRGRFLVSVLPGVLEAAREYQVPPSITLAQAVLESGWGRSGLATRANNLFGVKAGAHSDKIRLNSREHIRGQLRPRRREFRRYDSVDDAILHHARILGEDRRYAHAREVWTDWPEFLDRISPRYASSPRYPTLVGEIVQLYELDRWDAMIARAAGEEPLTDDGPDDTGAVADAQTDTGRPRP